MRRRSGECLSNKQAVYKESVNQAGTFSFLPFYLPDKLIRAYEQYLCYTGGLIFL